MMNGDEDAFEARREPAAAGSGTSWGSKRASNENGNRLFSPLSITSERPLHVVRRTTITNPVNTALAL